MCKDSVINFNSSDWDSIQDTINKVNEVGCQFGTTEQGENIMFNIYVDEEGTDCLVTEILQSNGWIRRNVYNPVAFSIEETFKKEYSPKGY